MTDEWQKLKAAEFAAKLQAKRAHLLEELNHYNYATEPPSETKYSLTTSRGQTPIYLSLDPFETAGLIEGAANVAKIHNWSDSSKSDWTLGILSETAIEQGLLYLLKRVSSHYLGERLKGNALDFKLWLDGKATRIGIKATTHENVERYDAIAYPTNRASDPIRRIADYVIGASVKLTSITLSDDDTATLERMGILDRVALTSAEIGVWGAISRDNLLSYLNNPDLRHRGRYRESDFVEIPLDAFSRQLLSNIQARAKQATYPKLEDID